MSLDEAVAHVRAGDAIHVVSDHSRWTAAARTWSAQWWGRDPEFTLVMLSLSSLGIAVLPGRPRPQGRDRVLGRRLPELHAEPVVLQGLPVAARSRSSTGRSSRSLNGSRPRPGACPPVTTRSIAGSSMADEPRVLAWSTRLRRGRAARGVRPRRRAAARRDRRPGRQPGLQPTEARRRVGGAGGQAGRDRHRRAGRRRHPTVVPPGAASRPTACWPWPRRPMGAHPGGLFARDTPGRRLRRGPRLLVRGPGDQPRGRRGVRRLDPPLGARPGRPDATTSAASAPSASRCCAGVPSPTRGVTTRPPTHPTSTRRPTRGSCAAAYGARLPGRPGRSPPAPTRCWPARASPTWRRGWPSSWPASRARRACSPPSSACGATSRRRPTRSCSTTGASRPRRCWATRPGARHAGRRARAPRCWPASARRRSTGSATSTRRSSATGTFLVGSGGGNDVASAADEVIVMSTLTVAASVAEVPYVTSPGVRVRAFVTDLGRVREAATA